MVALRYGYGNLADVLSIHLLQLLDDLIINVLATTTSIDISFLP